MQKYTNFRAARLAAGISVADVMKSLSVSDAAVYGWETGSFLPRAELLPKIAKLYNCSIDDLLRKE